MRRFRKLGIKVLFFDIEITPNLGFTWGKYEQNVIRFREEWRILSFSYRINNGPIFTEAAKKSDRIAVEKLWVLFDEADIIVGHNSDKFDIKKVHARFAYYGLPPVSPYKTLDTLKIARRYFSFTSNKLDDLGEYMGLGRKLRHDGFDLWLRCMANDSKAWKKMLAYNAQDVRLLCRVFYRLLPFVQNFPKIGKATCQCGSTDVIWKGVRNLKARFICRECGRWGTKKHQ